MDISVPVCNFVCLVVFFVWLRISPPRIKLAASNFALWFIGVQGRESPICVNFAPQKARIGERTGHAHRCNISCEVGLACVDRGQSPLMYLSVDSWLFINVSYLMTYQEWDLLHKKCMPLVSKSSSCDLSNGGRC